MEKNGNDHGSLPDAWFSYETDPQKYFYNSVTGETTWERPTDHLQKMEHEALKSKLAISQEQSSEINWFEYHTDDAYPYFYNQKTGETVWDRPQNVPINSTATSRPASILAIPADHLQKTELDEALKSKLAISQEQSESNWFEYHNDDTPPLSYFYNQKTEETVWDRPQNVPIIDATYKKDSITSVCPEDVVVATSHVDKILSECEVNKQLNQLTSIYPQLVTLSQQSTMFTSLAVASPQSIQYLKTLGDNGVIAEQQYSFIRSDPLLYDYYISFNQAVSSAVLACQSINSGMVADSRVSNEENIVSFIDAAANASGFPGVSIATGICSFLVKLPNDALRIKSVNRVTTSFPSMDSHKYIEILSRELTILQQDEIRSVATSEAVRRTAWLKVKRTVEWLQTLDNKSFVSAYASSHACVLLDKLMTSDPAIEQGDVSRLIGCILGTYNATVLMAAKLKSIREGSLISTANASQSIPVTLVPSVNNNELKPTNNLPSLVVETHASQSFTPLGETESLKAKLAAMEEKDRVREERERQREERDKLRDSEVLLLREESEKQKRVAAALQKEVGKLSPKDNSQTGGGGQAQSMMPQPDRSRSSQGGYLDDKVHIHEARIEHANVAISDIMFTWKRQSNHLLKKMKLLRKWRRDWPHWRPKSNIDCIMYLLLSYSDNGQMWLC